ncbi:MAG TPA: hypothetical protein P5046_04955, partial [Sphaerochaeta sp.]|nr:hypothetical protein [Sphaerochaeta sp.]
RTVNPFCDQITDLIALERPVQLLCKDFRYRALLVSPSIFFKSSYCGIESFQEKRLPGTIFSKDKIDRTETRPAQILE